MLINPFAEAMARRYTLSFFERLYQTFLVFTGRHFKVYYKDKTRYGILDLFVVPQLSSAMLSGALVLFDMFLAAPIFGIIFLPLSLSVAIIALPLEFVRYTLAILLTIAVSPIVAIAHYFYSIKAKPFHKDIRNMVPCDAATAPLFDSRDRYNTFDTKSFFFSPDSTLPPACSFKICEIDDQLVFICYFYRSSDFQYSGYNSDYYPALTRAYQLNEENSPGFAALLQINSDFVKSLQERGYLEKVQQMIKKPVKKATREAIAQTIDRRQRFELLFLPIGSSEQVLSNVYEAQPSVPPLHPTVVLQLQKDQTINVTWKNQNKVYSLSIANPEGALDLTKHFPKSHYGFWKLTPNKITETQNIDLVNSVLAKCVDPVGGLSPANLDFNSRNGMPPELLNLIYGYVGCEAPKA